MISIIIINYNTFALTCACIESIVVYCADADYEIVLVDNQSTEVNADRFKEKFPFITLVKNEANNGFAGGNNAGLAVAKGDYFLLLNTDTYFTSNPLPACVSAFQANEKLGAVGVRMTYPDGGRQNTARRFRSIAWELWDLCRPLLKGLPYKQRAQKMLGRYFHSDFDVQPDWLNGAFLMLSKPALQALGGRLDDRWFMYGEDVLWCWQLKQKGFICQFLHQPSIVHINSGSSSPQRRIQLLKLLMQRELELMAIMKGKRLYYYVFAAIFLAKDYSRYLVKKVYFQATGKLMKG